MANTPTLSTLAGKTVVVTGASDGIGKAAVRAYVAAGASVVMIGRNEAKTAAAAQAILRDAGPTTGTEGRGRAVTWEIADLSRQQDVHDVADRLLARLPRIDVLANNAGAMFLDRDVTPEGFERTFALNHLSYFTLTLRLLAPLVAAAQPGAPSRVLNVSSRAHANARPALDDLQLERQFGGWKQYANSKLYNIWFTRALARRLDASRVATQALHPGVVSTRFATNNGLMGQLLRRVMDVVSVTPAQGADTLVWLSSAPEALEGSGDYWRQRRRVTPSGTARDDARAEALWTTTSRLTGLDADRLIRDAMTHAVA
jgi:NAD(P)-dependent dehydrogenase (short-subunit alcohol dehydrogenase family)